MTQIDLFQSFLAMLLDLQYQALALIVLMALVVLSGTLKALKQKVFEWRQLADFMVTLVVPRFFGWFLLEVFAWMLGLAMFVIPDEAGITASAAQTLATGAFALIFLSLFGQFLGNMREIGLVPPEPKDEEVF